MSCKFTFFVFFLLMLFLGCVSERTIGSSISEEKPNQESLAKPEGKIVKNENAQQTDNLIPLSAKLKSNLSAGKDLNLSKILPTDELPFKDAEHSNKRAELLKDNGSELADDKKNKILQTDPFEIKKIKTQKDKLTTMSNSLISKSHSDKENELETPEIKSRNDDQNLNHSSISIENEKNRISVSQEVKNNLDLNRDIIGTKKAHFGPILRIADKGNTDPKIDLDGSINQKGDDSKRQSIELSEAFDLPLVRNSETINRSTNSTEEQEASDELQLRLNSYMESKNFNRKEIENIQKKGLRLKKRGELDIPNELNTDSSSSVKLNPLLGQDTGEDGDDFLRQINLKNLDNDSRNYNLDEPIQNLALRENPEHGGGKHPRVPNQKQKISLSEPRKEEIKKFNGSDILRLNRNSSALKDMSNFRKVREWSSRSLESNFSLPLEEKRVKQYERAKEWIRKKGRVLK